MPYFGGNDGSNALQSVRALTGVRLPVSGAGEKYIEDRRVERLRALGSAKLPGSAGGMVLGDPTELLRAPGSRTPCFGRPAGLGMSLQSV